jgi:hypothetical protein
VYSIGALALAPGSSDVLYVGTGEANAAVDSYDGAGLFRTTDGGASWEFLGLETTRRIARVAIDPTDPARLFVAAMGTQFSSGPDRGLYRSTDGGGAWQRVLSLNDTTGVCDVVLHPAHPETLYAASWERIRRPTYRRAFGPGCGIWRSTNGGDTWARLQSGLPAPSDSVGRIGLAIAPSRPTTIYAQIIGGGQLLVHQHVRKLRLVLRRLRGRAQRSQPGVGAGRVDPALRQHRHQLDGPHDRHARRPARDLDRSRQPAARLPGQ